MADRTIWMNGGRLMLAIPVADGGASGDVYRYEVVVQFPDGCVVRGTADELRNGATVNIAEEWDDKGAPTLNRVEAVSAALNRTGYGRLKNELL